MLEVLDKSIDGILYPTINVPSCSSPVLVLFLGVLVMLVVYRTGALSKEFLAQRIILSIFGALPDKELEKDIPFIQLLEEGTEFFCYEHQFSIGFKETETNYQFSPWWHSAEEKEETIQKEKAICVLHKCFKYVEKK